MSQSKVSVTVLLLLGTVLIGPGCRQAPDGEKVRLQLNWLPDAQFGGYLAAHLHGEYAAEGLEVEIVPGGPGIAVIPKVALGRVEFGVGNADQVLLARRQGGKLVAVMASLQDSPRCIMVHESAGFLSLRDIRDVTLAMEAGSIDAQFLRAHAPLTNVRFVAYAGSVARFVLEKDFAQQAYVFSEPLVARRQGSDPQSLMLSDLGFNPYAGVVITSEAYLHSHRELVQKFVRATCRGWYRYLQDPRATNAEIHRQNPEMDPNSLQEATAIIGGLCRARGHAIGTMSEERWKVLAGQMTELGAIRLSAEEVRRCFSLEFVAKSSGTAESRPPSSD